MIVSDNFNYAGSVLNAAKWTSVSTYVQPAVALSTLAKGAGGGGSPYSAAVVLSSFGIGADQYAQAYINGAAAVLPPAAYLGVTVRGGTGTKACYLLQQEFYDDFDVVAYYYISLYNVTPTGAQNILATWGVDGAGVNAWTKTLRLEVSGYTLTAKIDGVVLGTVTDTSANKIASGQPGIFFTGSNNGTTLDNFEAGDLGGGVTTLGPIRGFGQGFNSGFGRGQR
jgi:hypothetical protein